MKEGRRNPVSYLYLKPYYFHYIGRSTRRLPLKTKFRESEIYEKFVREKEGIPCTEYGHTQPTAAQTYKASSKYNKVNKIMDPKAIPFIKQCLMNEWYSYVRDSRFLSLEESLALQKAKTSNGWPYNIVYPNARSFMLDPNMIAWVMIRADDKCKEVYYPDASSENPKDERLPIDKLKEGRIRAINGMNQVNKIHGTMSCWDFNDKFNNAAVVTSSFCGGVKFYGMWDYMSRQLLKHPMILEADGSQWDSTLGIDIFSLILWFRLESMSEECNTNANRNFLKNYYMEMFYCYFVNVEAEIFTKTIGNMSGQINTIVDNTLALFIMTSYCYWRAVPDATYKQYKRTWTLFLNGDDNISSMTEELYAVLGPEKLAAFANEIGPVLEIQVNETLKCREALLERTFLSQRFLLDDYGIWLPAPTLQRCIASLQLVKEDTPVRLLLTACACRINGWADRQIRHYVNTVIEWLLQTYDKVLRGDMEWMDAKRSIITDKRLSELYYGMYRVHV